MGEQCAQNARRRKTGRNMIVVGNKSVRLAVVRYVE
jgi:hypothetical protein